jgi:hypothetical protein
MEFCRILVEKAGHDGTAMQPNGAFLAWCQNNPEESAAVIREARVGNGLAKQFATFALQAANDLNSAIQFAQSYVDDRRLSAMTALARMTFADSASAQEAVAVLEPFVADSSDDHIRGNALLAIFEVFKNMPIPKGRKGRLRRQPRTPDRRRFMELAQAVSLHHASLDDQALATALHALEAVDPEHLGSVRTLDFGLLQLLGTKSETRALDFLAAKLRDGKLTTKNFEMTAGALTSGNLQRLYELIVRWFLSGNFALAATSASWLGSIGNALLIRVWFRAD